MLASDAHCPAAFARSLTLHDSPLPPHPANRRWLGRPLRGPACIAGALPAAGPRREEPARPRPSPASPRDLVASAICRIASTMRSHHVTDTCACDMSCVQHHVSDTWASGVSHRCRAASPIHGCVPVAGVKACDTGCMIHGLTALATAAEPRAASATHPTRCGRRLRAIARTARLVPLHGTIGIARC